MRGNGHDTAGAVIRQHKIRREDRHFFIGHRVQTPGIQKDAFLLVIIGRPHHLVLLLDTLNKGPDILLHRFPLREFHHEGMLRRYEHERGAVYRVLPGGQDLDDIIGIGPGKDEFASVALTDPVLLHREHPFRPAGQFVAVIQKLLHIIGNAEKPLVKILFRNLTSTSPAQTRLHLFIGQNCLACRAPVDRPALFVGESLFVHPEKEELLPAVVFRFTGRYFSIPVITEPHPLELYPHGVDVLVCPLRGGYPVFDGGILRGHAEGIPSDGMQHVISAHLLIPCHHVADGIVSHMPHMDPSGRIRKHLQKIIFFLRGVFSHLEGFFILPVFLPLFFYFRGVIFPFHVALP